MSLDAFKAYKTLQLHGPLTARGIAANWAVVTEPEVTDRALERVTVMLDLLDERGLVEPVRGGVTVDDDTIWRALVLPDDKVERNALVRDVNDEWKRVRGTIGKKKVPPKAHTDDG